MSNLVAAPVRALLGLALIAGVAAPAFAETRIDVMASSAKARTLRTPVKVADLNLTSQEGMAALDRRIALAASEVCGKDQLYNLDAKSDYKRCRADAIANAHGKIQQRVAASGGAPRSIG